MSKLTPRTKKELRARRHKRIRAKVRGTAEKPRLAVFRSNRYISVQLIDDEARVTLAASTSKGMKAKGMAEGAASVGKDIAAKAKAKGVSAIVFDRGGFTYAGVIRALADAARENGLKF